ncbi:putative pentatricopeptide repeat-containing protein [Ananas comosus]|uniref:Putative pentatricopeptide repeat-containing protein n=1 Tax=Ananas comosus TaxID=4615 RepID=A0A199VLX2_ANACO|nr:putative pentatricopeptide repeat-containing protein [Ananas comosus]
MRFRPLRPNAFPSSLTSLSPPLTSPTISPKRFLLLLRRRSATTEAPDHALVDAAMVKTGFDLRTYRANHLLDSLLRRGDFSRARQLFDEMPHKNTFTVNRMISCYARAGDLDEAVRLFALAPHRNAVTWTILIGACSAADRSREALSLFVGMTREGIRPDHVAITAALGVCGSGGGSDASNWAEQIHTHVVKSGFGANLVVCNTLVDSYCKCELLSGARTLFDEMPERDSVTYNAIIMGYSKEGSYFTALELFIEMRDLILKPSQFTFSGVLTSATGLCDLGLGKQIHGLVVKANFGWNVFVNNSLLDFYSKCHCLGDAEALFDEMAERDNVSYNVMISGYAWNGCVREFLDLFREMQLMGFDRKACPFASLLSVAGAVPSVQMGRQIHAQVIITDSASDDLVGNALIDMYSKCGMLDVAEMIFMKKHDKNTVSWTSIISGYIQNGYSEEALKLFCEMRRAGLNPDRATFSTILRASSGLAMVSVGKQLHSYLIRFGYLSNVFSGSALLDTYAKCGCLDESHKIFQEMPERNIVSWNAMVAAYAQNGLGKKAIEIFEEMLRSGVEPDLVTFLSVLSACSHSGLVDEGLWYFELMTREFGLNPTKDHYACVIDILGRVGRFDEVEKLLSQIPFDSDQIIWNSILNSCRIHGHQELGQRAADKLFRMELKDAAPFVIMSNLYAKSGQWEEAAKVKKMMRDRGVRKEPAYSWVEIKEKAYTFSSNDQTNSRISEIKSLLKNLSEEMEKDGYKPDIGCADHLFDEGSEGGILEAAQ